MKFDKALVEKSLVYVPIWEPTQGYIHNITSIMLALNHPL